MNRPGPAHVRRRPVAARQGRAFSLMVGLGVLCIALAIVPAAVQLARHGAHAFTVRPAGVGASPAVSRHTSSGSSASSESRPQQTGAAPTGGSRSVQRAAARPPSHNAGTPVGTSLASLVAFVFGGVAGVALAYRSRARPRMRLALHRA